MQALNNTIEVLDHGFVRLMNIAGPTRRIHTDEHEDSFAQFDAHDRDPANVARMSFDAMNTRTEEEDLKLADYLMRNWHTTPFESIEVWLEMKLPIFVARQFVRHRTTSLNEVSGRYVKLPAEWYIPAVVGGKPVGGAKQGQSDTLPDEEQFAFKRELNWHCEAGYAQYTHFIENGVAPEHARMFLSLNHYTHWTWKQNLHNLFHFLSLRDHPHAQIEAQCYAQAIDLLIRSVLPRTMELYDKYRRQER